MCDACKNVWVLVYCCMLLHNFTRPCSSYKEISNHRPVRSSRASPVLFHLASLCIFLRPFDDFLQPARVKPLPRIVDGGGRFRLGHPPQHPPLRRGVEGVPVPVLVHRLSPRPTRVREVRRKRLSSFPGIPPLRTRKRMLVHAFIITCRAATRGPAYLVDSRPQQTAAAATADGVVLCLLTLLSLQVPEHCAGGGCLHASQPKLPWSCGHAVAVCRGDKEHSRERAPTNGYCRELILDLRTEAQLRGEGKRPTFSRRLPWYTISQCFPHIKAITLRP